MQAGADGKLALVSGTPAALQPSLRKALNWRLPLQAVATVDERDGGSPAGDITAN
jgi:hypothetical protein